MKKIVLTALPVLALALAAPVAHADDGAGLGGGAEAANNWNFAAAEVCPQELAIIPAMANYVSDEVNNCSNGNVVS
ncbi:hypothetical protein [Streptomyces griseus]|uniref:hypothetical protein n=1 Tax=Streptomyces griseus TaxID=1911 RepID=UPI0033F48C19